ncbi:hypothetical protein JI75_06500 [Berryella intestinalis]|uniref:Molecular chaperone TorD n=1 Tax=Berryella intestinalis TaxID=1531429 RepID=A0A0A8B4S0_9ACTN|nr:molecular chaperone TorD family protein [Berryella intestinalis]AJC12354.1 hypothetical protein JI75_06500 [Berryella intestinalis]
MNGTESTSLAIDYRYRADIYLLLARAFSHEPDDAFRTALGSIGKESPLVVNRDSDGNLVQRAFDLINRSVSTDPSPSDLNADYVNIFLGFGKDLTGAFPYESYYRSGRKSLMEKPYDELLSILRKEGLTPTQIDLSPEDHVSTEFLLLAHFSNKVLAALERARRNENDGSDIQQTQDKSIESAQARYRDFLVTHPLQWVPQMCDEAFALARTDFYRGFSLLAKEVVIADATALGFSGPTCR